MEEKKLHQKEVISRYLFKGDFDSDLNVKPKALKPSKKDSALSVYRFGALDIPGCTAELSENEIWGIADQMIGVREHKGGVTARADFEVAHVLKAKVDLEVVEHQEDHLRHAHIQPFPVIEESASEEDKRKIDLRCNTISTQLAADLSATLRQQNNS